jgi:hypothetical protein
MASILLPDGWVAATALLTAGSANKHACGCRRGASVALPGSFYYLSYISKVQGKVAVAIDLAQGSI